MRKKCAPWISRKTTIKIQAVGVTKSEKSSLLKIVQKPLTRCPP
jgi:hypothetical protein